MYWLKTHRSFLNRDSVFSRLVNYFNLGLPVSSWNARLIIFDSSAFVKDRPKGPLPGWATIGQHQDYGVEHFVEIYAEVLEISGSVARQHRPAVCVFEHL
jgi:hypothetical protein